MTANKHLHVTVSVSYGEYSHLSDTVATVEAHVDPSQGAEIVAKNWQETPGRHCDGEWCFDDGMGVKVSKVVEVPPSILKCSSVTWASSKSTSKTKPKPTGPETK